MNRFDKGFVAVVVFIMAGLFVQVTHAKTHDKVDKVGKTVTEQTLIDVNKELKKLDKLEIPAGTYTDIELADLIRAAFGAGLIPKKEKKVK